MSFLYDNAATLAVAAVCGALAWIFGGMDWEALTPAMPWLLALLAEISLLFPQRHRGESLSDARGRVWRNLKKDPVAWTALAFLALLAIPFWNRGLCPCCDYPAIHFDGASEEPPAAFLPFCVNAGEHGGVFLWFACALSAMLAARHALLKRGKRTLVELLAWNGMALAILGMVQKIGGAEAPFWTDPGKYKVYFFSSFGYPNTGASWFTLSFALACAAWRWRAAEGERENEKKSGYFVFWRHNIFLIPAAFCFVGAVLTLSRAGMIMVSALAVVQFVHAMVCSLAKMRRSQRARAFAAGFIVLVLSATLVGILFAGGSQRKAKDDVRAEIAREVESIGTRGVLDRLTGRNDNSVDLALRIWRKWPVFGCGGWGFRHFAIPAMTAEEFKPAADQYNGGGANVHNDYIQFLAEHGVAGVLLLAAIAALLLAPFFATWKALAHTAHFLPRKERPPRPVSIFALPAPAFSVFLGIAAVAVHAFGDCPLRSGSVLALLFVSLAALDGYMPRRKEESRN